MKMHSHAKLLALGLSLAFLATTTACSGSASGSGGGVTVSSLSSIPDINDLVGTSADANLSAMRFAVTGTAPILSEISAEDADTLFWNGLIDDINTNGADQSDAEDFWQGEGRCRMAQSVGYSFQNIQQAGTSLCYMKNAPTADSGVEIVSGSATPSTLFNQEAETKLVNIQVTAPDGGGEGGGPEGDMNIFIRVYGSDSIEGADGYAVDLYFCDEDATVSRGLEQIRVNTGDGTFTQTTAETSFGSFVMQASATLTEDADGNPVFDVSQPRQAEVFFSGDFGDGSTSFKSLITIDGDELVSKDYSANDFGVGGEFSFKNRIVSSYSGASMADLRFLEATFCGQSTHDGDEFDPFCGATEFQTTRYVDDTDVSVSTYDFDGDSFYDGVSAPSLLGDADSGDCTATPDVVVTMDFADPGVQEVAAQCETFFADMNFCDSDEVNQARGALFNAF